MSSDAGITLSTSPLTCAFWREMAMYPSENDTARSRGDDDIRERERERFFINSVHECAGLDVGGVEGAVGVVAPCDGPLGNAQRGALAAPELLPKIG